MSQDRVAHRARRFGMDINDGSWGSRVAALDLPTRLTESSSVLRSNRRFVVVYLARSIVTCIMLVTVLRK